ncbi:MAG: cellobiose phosphorylase [Firmicutes bacterium]|nr:cellobiose phosphorylase [Bacillota bacterium]
MSYQFNQNQFIIQDYDKKKTFSSFLPGIAGLKGIPLWVFYANRGQGVTSFGVRDKDEPILEFFPANTSYQYVDRYGFRSFVRVDEAFYEPFSVATTDVVSRQMAIASGHFSIEEMNHTRGVNYKVTYFGLPNEPLAGLVRKVEIENRGETRLLEVVDGLASILPSGATNEGYKSMSNLMMSWMGVENMAEGIPFYKFRASSGDEAEVSMIHKGHFYLSFAEDGAVIKPIIDPELVFGYDTSLTSPVGLKEVATSELDLSHQVAVNKVPCGFTPYAKRVEAGESVVIHTIIGHVADVAIINELAPKYARRAFMEAKRLEAQGIIDALVSAVETKTRFEAFDAYMKQNFLDNALRGGYPLMFGEGEDQKVYHVYSRKHGDPERDYNFFTLAPEYYSQGNGNFRDVNQNRRNDVLFFPEAGLFNIRMFMSLVQLDGYNPLGVQGTTFTLPLERAKALMAKHGIVPDQKLTQLFSGKFTPGKVSMALEGAQEAFLEAILAESEQHIEAVFGEGFWSDHWTYNFDLIENYVGIYPDRVESLLMEDRSYRYFESPVTVLPRHLKVGLTKDGQVRQYGAIEEEAHSNRFKQACWVTDQDGEVVHTHLAEKLLTLVMTKTSSLDPFGMGIEMEANKPGWNDAMNGLPGVFGSGLSETVELLRIVRFLLKHVTGPVTLLEENYEFFNALQGILKASLSLFSRWDALSSAKETFRETVKGGVKGGSVEVSLADILSFLQRVEAVLEDGLQRSKADNGGILPTYIAYKAVAYEKLAHQTPYGLDAVRVLAFEPVHLPNFLEAPARSLKIGSVSENLALYEKVKQTALYDTALKTYKTSEPLDHMSHEIGRIRAFTPGWLERESNFLHMTYKYLLGLLKGGLYDVFYEEIKTNWVCFMDPVVYGRSPLENSSFIASSVNPNPKVHGQGFVSRLSGSVAEMLSMWHLMMFGHQLFTYDGVLRFTPKPILHEDLFVDGRVETTLFNHIAFIIDNPTGLATYAADVEIAHYTVDGEQVDEIKGELAQKIRDKKVKQIIMTYKKSEG